MLRFLLTVESVHVLSCPSSPVSRALSREMPVVRMFLATDVAVSGVAIITSTFGVVIE